MKASAPSGAIVFAATLITYAFAWDGSPVDALVCASMFGLVTGLFAWLRDS